MPKPRAISWAAVSSKPQAERESLNDQHRLNHALADALEWEIITDVTTPGESRSYYRLSDARANLEAYQQLTELAEAGAFDWLICKSRDRLARTRRLNREVAGFLQDHGIRVYSRTFPPASTEERTEAEVWSEAIESGYSEAEILRLTQRHEMGMQARVRHGKLASRLAWGFSRVVHPDTRELTVAFTEPRAEEAIRFAVTRYHVGISKKRIVEEANRDGVPTAKGGEWTLNTVDQIVLQPAYYGLTSWGRRRWITKDGRKVRKWMPIDEWIVAEGDFDAPFTPSDWHKTVAERRRRAREHPRRHSTRFPLSGIAWCQQCDIPMIGSTVGTGQRYYRCGHPWQPHKDSPVNRHFVRDSALHEQIGDYLRQLATKPSRIRDLMNQEEDRSTEDLAAQQDAVLAQQDGLLRRRDRWQRAYGAGVISLVDFAARLEEIEAEEAMLESRLEKIEHRLEQDRRRSTFGQFLRECAAQLPSNMRELSDRQREALRAIFSRLFKRVYVEDKRIQKVELNLE